MRERIVRFALGAMLVALSFPAAAQQPGKVYRIGLLAGSSQALNWQPMNEAFQQGLRELGYVEGKNVIMVTAGGSEIAPNAEARHPPVDS